MEYLIMNGITPEDIIPQAEVEKVLMLSRPKLDYQNWGCIDILYKTYNYIILQVRITEPAEDDPYRVCIQYGGSGKYFQTLADATQYACKRFGRKWWCSHCKWV